MSNQETSHTVNQTFPNTLNSMKPQPTSITVKEYLTVKHDKPQPTNLNQEDKILNQLCQTRSIS